MVQTQTENTRHHIIKNLSNACICCVLAGSMMFASVLTYAGLPGTTTRAFAVTSAEKQAEVDAALVRLDELQTELNQIEAEYATAIATHADAEQRMRDAQERENAARTRIAELQEQLGALAIQMYHRGPTSFLDVVFGAESFGDFVIGLQMANRINAHNAALVAESKVVKAEAEAARIEYSNQEKIAAEVEMQLAELRAQKESTFAEMQAEIDALKEEAAELLAQEILAAEAARLRAEEEARRAASANSGGGGYVDPSLLGRVPYLVFPCPGYSYISSPYGYRGGEFHLGTDMAAPTGSAILAAATGTVTAAGYQGSMGNYVIINHGNGVRTIYMHASALYVSAGETAYAGQTIAAVGSTGNSTGPHLHFQLEIDGQAVDAMLFL